MPLGVLPGLHPYTIDYTAAGPVTLSWRPWTVFVVEQAVPAAFTLILPPAPVRGTIVQVKDGLGVASTNAITIDGNGLLIDGAATLDITTDYGAVYLGYDGTEWRLLANVGSGGGGGGGVNSVTVTQPLTLTASNIAVYYDGQVWRAADASDGNKLGLGIVTDRTVDPNGVSETFTVVFSGIVTLTETPPLQLIPGQYYFASAATPGLLTVTEPVNPGEFSNPLLFALSATEGLVLPFRPSAIAGPLFPGPATDLIDASGNPVAVGSGLSYSGGPGGTLTGTGGGGPAPAIDADHAFVYACDQASGPVILNTGSVAGGNITLAGDVTYESGRLGRSAKSIYFAPTVATDGGFTGAVAYTSAVGFTLEAFLTSDTVPYNGYGNAIFAAKQAGTLYYHGIYNDGTNWYGNFGAMGSFDILSPGIKMAAGVPIYLGISWVPGTLKTYVNGRLWNTLATPVPAGPIVYDKLSICNNARPGLGIYPLNGAFMQGRFSVIARDAAYFKATADTLFKM